MKRNGFITTLELIFVQETPEKAYIKRRGDEKKNTQILGLF